MPIILATARPIGPAGCTIRRGVLLRLRPYPIRWCAAPRRLYLFNLLQLVLGGDSSPKIDGDSQYFGNRRSDAPAGCIIRRGFLLRLRPYLIHTILTCRSFDLLLLQPPGSGGVSAASPIIHPPRPLPPPSYLSDGLFGKPRGQSKR